MVHISVARKNYFSNEFTVKQLAERVIEWLASKSKLVCKPLPEDDPKQRQPDISLAKKELQREPTIELDVGLNMPIEYF